jgi:glutamate synthase (NADPH/NADH) small chain
VPVPDSEHDLDVDLVVFAIGTNANPIIGQTSALALNKRGYIAVDDDLATSIAGVYAGGDIVTGAATVIEAMGAGRHAARSMKAYLGLSDPSALRVPGDPSASLFGLTPDQRNFVRLRVA